MPLGLGGGQGLGGLVTGEVMGGSKGRLVVGSGSAGGSIPGRTGIGGSGKDLGKACVFVCSTQTYYISIQ